MLEETSLAVGSLPFWWGLCTKANASLDESGSPARNRRAAHHLYNWN